MLWDLIWGSLWNTGFWSKCFGIVFLPLTYLPPQIPAAVPKWLFRTQFSKFWVAQKQIDQHRGCIPQSALAVRKPQQWTFQTPQQQQRKATMGTSAERKLCCLRAEHSMWPNPTLGWRVERNKLQGLSSHPGRGRKEKRKRRISALRRLCRRWKRDSKPCKWQEGKILGWRRWMCAAQILIGPVVSLSLGTVFQS